ncbi:MAG: adenine phosphoribosyltransferase [Candidatus Omnitrophica bacterium]|nr:adenine phosphoribosyltransferase [Candidatus Omnitrophota bacterium]
MIQVARLKERIRDVADFPKKGIVFKDITTLLKDGESLKLVADLMVEEARKMDVDVVAGIESRGFIFAPMIAARLGVGFIPIRKKGKLPHKTVSVTYQLEYGTDSLEIHKDAIEKGTRVLVIDDLLATGGTSKSVAKLIEKLGGIIEGFGFLIELSFLKGRDKLKKYPVFSLIQY